MRDAAHDQLGALSGTWYRIVRKIGQAGVLVSCTWSAAATAEERDPEVERLFAQGMAAEESGELGVARESYRRAWSRERTPAIAGSLGLVEVALRQYTDALEHLYFALERVSDREVRGILEDAAREAEGHVAVVRVRAPAGSTLWLVTESSRRTPANPGDVFVVYPGTYTLEASRPGHDPVRRELTLRAGEKRELTVDMAAGAELAEPSPDAAARGEGQDARRVQRWVLGAGGAVTAVALGVGAGFGIAAGSAKRKAESAREQLAARYGLSDHMCFENPDPLCDELRHRVDQHGARRAVALGSFLSAGAVALGTGLAWAFWPQSTARVSLVPRPGGVELSLRFGARGAVE